MIQADEFPKLKYFLQCYYHQDWDHLYGTPAGVIDALIREDDPGTPAAIRADLDRFIGRQFDVKTIDDWLTLIRCGGYINAENPSEQLIEFRDLLAQRLA